MVELHVNVNCEGIKNSTYEDHSSLGEMHTIQNYVCGGSLLMQYNYGYLLKK